MNGTTEEISTTALHSLEITDALGNRYLTRDIDFGATGADEVYQNVKYILLTEYFSVPLDREFGMDFTMVDKPMQIAEAMLSQEVAMKIAFYEPRCQFREISFGGNAADGKLAPKVIIEILVTDELPSRYPDSTLVAPPLGTPVTPTVQVTFADFFTGLLQTSKVPGPPGAQGPVSTVPGPPGINAFTATAAPFTIPPVGQTVQVEMEDASWIIVGQLVWMDTAGGSAGEAGTLQVTAKDGNILTLMNPPPGSIPLADDSTDGLLRMVSGLATDFVDGTNTCRDLAVAIAALLLPTGTVLDFAGVIAPSGFLIADGSAVDRILFAGLFAVIGTAFGAGDGSTTFNLPDCRGRAAVGAGQGGGLTDRILAAAGGEESHPLTIAELASHTHIQNAHTHIQNAHRHDLVMNAQGSTPGGGALGPVSGAGPWSSTTTVTPTNQNTTATNQNAGSGTAHNNMPPFIALNKIIKT
jgi:microcystin-dependent protein/phage baseplate assembly protein W